MSLQSDYDNLRRAAKSVLEAYHRLAEPHEMSTRMTNLESAIYRETPEDKPSTESAYLSDHATMAWWEATCVCGHKIVDHPRYGQTIDYPCAIDGCECKDYQEAEHEVHNPTRN